MKALAFRAEAITKTFTTRSGQRILALQDVSFESAEDSITCLLGPTGSGKSTLLRLLAGLERPDKGHVLVGDSDPASIAGKIGYMTQEHTLLPWLRVCDNIALPLEAIGMPRAERIRSASSIAASLGLGGVEELYPHELSGGMQQRAAMGRLLAQQSQFWLLDEPFANLDERTRHELQSLLTGIIKEHGLSVIFVTHSLDEAIWLADKAIVLSAGPGKVVESFKPRIERPRDRMTQEYGDAMERIRRSLESVIGQ